MNRMPTLQIDSLLLTCTMIVFDCVNLRRSNRGGTVDAIFGNGSYPPTISTMPGEKCSPFCNNASITSSHHVRRHQRSTAASDSFKSVTPSHDARRFWRVTVAGDLAQGQRCLFDCIALRITSSCHVRRDLRATAATESIKRR